MKTHTFHLELITPCFCGGAEPDKQAEIRAPSIRGQLRWWFRTLGGFKSLAPMSVRDQETLIFGSTAGKDGYAGKLHLQVRSLGKCALRSGITKNVDDLKASKPFDPIGYLLFPLRKQDQDLRKRGVFDSDSPFPRFEVRVILSATAKPWSDSKVMLTDIQALLSIFAHLGSLGFRGRRAMGALQPITGGTLEAINLKDCWAYFSNPNGVEVLELNPESDEFKALIAKENKFRSSYNSDPAHARSPIPLLNPATMNTASLLAVWLRAWRQHGQMNVMWPKGAKSPSPIPSYQKDYHRSMPGFPKARRDHNEGLARLSFPHGSSPASASAESEKIDGNQGETFRPAIGLPIIQSFSSFKPRKTVNWGTAPKGENDSKGRFASPVLLRPHKDAQGNWHALVIFVEAHKWPNDPATGQPKQVFLNGQPRAVSLDLYNAMKSDPRLHPFL